ncbi:MAG: DUF2842 domain-containing protein [Henriciella sp.]
MRDLSGLSSALHAGSDSIFKRPRRRSRGPELKPSNRRLIASLIILTFLAFWIWAAGSIGSALSDAPRWLTLLFFIAAGLGWAVPLRPVLRWMNSGQEDTD